MAINRALSGGHLVIRGIAAPARMQLKPTAEELQRWPLTHGTPVERKILNEIREHGIMAGAEHGNGANSYNYDEVLGRTLQVFLKTANFRFEYGYGVGLLIDPAVMELAGVKWSTLDVGDVVNCVETIIDGVREHDSDEFVIKSQAPHYEELRELVLGELETANEEEWIKDTLIRVIGSSAFRDYYERFCFVSRLDFFSKIEDSANECKFSLLDYFNRRIWGLKEEILVPRIVPPEFVLGYWNGAAWEEWRKASSAERQLRVDEWVGTLYDLSHSA